jgi:hypothetical protein
MTDEEPQELFDDGTGTGWKVKEPEKPKRKPRAKKDEPDDAA